LPGWVQVDYNGSEGYIRHKFLVDDKAAADAALASEQAAQAALAAQTQTYSYDYSGSYGGGGYSGGGSTGGGNAGGGSDACVTNGLLN
ncbi:MAG: hypothetical protein HUJ72_01825, partial [Blautia sp.]|nr:hypothetical protein [Blautia sp.]